MKVIYLIPLFVLALLSCKKEDAEPQNSSTAPVIWNPSSQHHLYVQGTFRDSLTNLPLAGYILNTPYDIDTVKADGSYFIKYTWAIGGYANPGTGQYEIVYNVKDPSGAPLGFAIHYESISSYENDTITRDFLF